MEVLDAIAPDVSSLLRRGAKTRGQLASMDPDLTSVELRALTSALRRAKLTRKLLARVALMLNFDRRRPRPGRGRHGAPARHQLKAALGECRRRVPEYTNDAQGRKRRICWTTVIAHVVLLHELDGARSLWPSDGRVPPVGRARARWIARRLRALELVDKGQGEIRRAKRP